LNIFWENITVLIPENVYIPRDRLTIGEGEVLGKGMSSVVRLGSFGKTQVAIKHMPLQIIEIESGEKPQFLRECGILFNTQHPRICRLYGFSYDSYWFVMVQEWCRGGDLRKAIVKVPDVVEQRACDFMVDVASALDHIHRQQIVHRDIKPENVLLSSEDTLVARCKGVCVCFLGAGGG
jgi:serine/threonine protein kinase